MRTFRDMRLVPVLLLLAAACSSAPAPGSSQPAPNVDDSSTSGGDPGAPPASATPPGTPGAPPATPPAGPDGIRVLVEPSDKAAAVLSAIQAAKTSVHVTMYLLDDSRFVDALIAQHKAGRDVKVVLNKTFQAGAGTNAAVYSQLQAAGVAVAWAPSTFSLTHEKCVLVDGTEAWIMTMNLEASSSANREYLAIDDSPSDVAEAEAIFAGDFANTASTPSGDLVVAPTNARTKLVALVKSAKTSIDLEGEELSDYQIVDALVAAQKAGVTVHVVLSNTTPTSSQTTSVQQLKTAGVQVRTLASPYVHAKALVVDGAQAYVGSANFTTGSLVYNRELGVITTNATAVGHVATTIASDFAAGS